MGILLNEIMVKEEEYWNRPCKTPGCFGLARPLSEYCVTCREKNKEKKNEI